MLLAANIDFLIFLPLRYQYNIRTAKYEVNKHKTRLISMQSSQ